MYKITSTVYDVCLNFKVCKKHKKMSVCSTKLWDIKSLIPTTLKGSSTQKQLIKLLMKKTQLTKSDIDLTGDDLAIKT